jgi:zinc protease
VNLLLREEKGFTYGAYTWFDFRRLPGPFALQTSVDTASTAAAIAASLDEIRSIRRSRPITRAEIDLAIAALTRGWARSFETPAQVARAIAQIALFDLPDEYYSTFVPRMEAVTAVDATDAMARHLDPDGLVTVVVGDRDRISGLESLGLGDPAVMMPETFW